MIEQPAHQLYRACQLQPTPPGVPFRYRTQFAGDLDHAAAPGEVWALCGAAAYDTTRLPFANDVPPAFLARPPRCPDCITMAAALTP